MSGQIIKRSNLFSLNCNSFDIYQKAIQGFKEL